MSTRPIFKQPPEWVQDVNSMLVSAACHLAVFITLGLLSIVVKDQWSGVKLEAIADGTSAVPNAELDSLRLEVADDAAAALGPTRLFDNSALAATDIDAPSVLAANSAQESGFDGLALGGSGEGERGADQLSAEFFGIGGYGQSFVYVVDCSDSMNERHKFERAIYELLQSIEQLASDQRYFVIFYNDNAYPMDADQAVSATEEEFARTRQWVSQVQPTGGTHPLPALLYALSLRPDAIYFLSDGQFDHSTIHALKSRNSGNKRLKISQIPIHTISFVDRAAEGLMRTIARNCGGQFRFVR